jgi:RNA polymerase sigma factor (sigma-70 family)
LVRAQAGDRRAADAIVRGLHPRVSRMAAYYARVSGENADDLLQEAWVGLLDALPHLDVTIGTPEQYLLQCARWRLLDAIKRARVRRCLPLDEAAHETVADTATECTVTNLGTTEFVQGLKTTQRDVLGCLLRGLTWREAGAALGCTSANVAYHVRQIQREYHAWQAETV